MLCEHLLVVSPQRELTLVFSFLLIAPSFLLPNGSEASHQGAQGS